MTTWHNYHTLYKDKHKHTITGTIKVAKDVKSPQLHNQRDILVYLPPSYQTSYKSYPVLFMNDGQNLFDKATSYAGEWCVDETMEKLSREEGLEAIVVGIPNMGAKRIAEYSPFIDTKHGGGLGDAYVSFIVDTVKPLIERDFRVQPGKRHCGVMGSSMGGLISLYAFFHRQDIFGFAGVMSPSLWFAQESIFAYIESVRYQPGKIYLDAGTREHGGSWPDILTLRTRSRRYYGRVRYLKRVLVKKGYRPVRNLLHIEEKWARHHEAAWARRLPAALRFFLQDL